MGEENKIKRLTWGRRRRRKNLVGDYGWRFSLLILNVEVLHINTCSCSIHFVGSFLWLLHPMIILNLILKFLVFRCLKQITSGVLISFFHFLGSHDSQKSLSYRSCSSVPSKSWSYEVLYETVQVLLLHISTGSDTYLTLCMSFGFDDVVQRRGR